MKYATKTITINPNKPVRQYGHMQQVNPVSKVNDDLHARIIALEDEKQVFVNFSCDLLGIDYPFTVELTKKLQPLFDKQLKIVVSNTHTHYAGDTRVEEYHKQLFEQFVEAVKQLEFKEGNLSVAYQSVPFEGVGKSRISNHKALVLLNLIRIFDDEREVITIINHNCHPTILSAVETDFFSGEYVGKTIADLNERNSSFHTFLQGAAGDVSTRFTRTGQHYQDVVILANRLTEKVLELKSQPVEKYPLEIAMEEKRIDIVFDFNDLDESLMPDNLSARELETIGFGKIVRKQLKQTPEKLQKDLVITRVGVGPYNMIYVPNELFSYYLSQINTSKAILNCYSNGYSPYVAPIDQIIYTYETFTDVLSRATKVALRDLLAEYSNR